MRLWLLSVAALACAKSSDGLDGVADAHFRAGVTNAIREADRTFVQDTFPGVPTFFKPTSLGRVSAVDLLPLLSDTLVVETALEEVWAEVLVDVAVGTLPGPRGADVYDTPESLPPGATSGVSDAGRRFLGLVATVENRLSKLAFRLAKHGISPPRNVAEACESGALLKVLTESPVRARAGVEEEDFLLSVTGLDPVHRKLAQRLSSLLFGAAFERSQDPRNEYWNTIKAGLAMSVAKALMNEPSGADAVFAASCTALADDLLARSITFPARIRGYRHRGLVSRMASEGETRLSDTFDGVYIPWTRATFSVQVGAYSELSRAQDELYRFERAHPDLSSDIYAYGGLYRVRVGMTDEPARALALVKSLRNERGYRDAFARMTFD